jgi:hypothetical protein
MLRRAYHSVQLKAIENGFDRSVHSLVQGKEGSQPLARAAKKSRG